MFANPVACHQVAEAMHLPILVKPRHDILYASASLS